MAAGGSSDRAVSSGGTILQLQDQLSAASQALPIAVQNRHYDSVGKGIIICID